MNLGHKFLKIMLILAQNSNDLTVSQSRLYSQLYKSEVKALYNYNYTFALA